MPVRAPPGTDGIGMYWCADTFQKTLSLVARVGEVVWAQFPGCFMVVVATLAIESIQPFLSEKPMNMLKATIYW